MSRAAGTLADAYADLRGLLLVPVGQTRFLRTTNQLGHPMALAVEASGVQYDHDGVAVCTWWTALEGDGWFNEAGDRFVLRDESCLVPLVQVNRAQLAAKRAAAAEGCCIV